MSANSDMTAKMAQLRREFGNGLAEDVLESVLAMLGGDVQETLKFLRAGKDDFVEDPNANGLPKDYMKKPSGWHPNKVPSLQKSLSEAAEQKIFFISTDRSFRDHMDRYEKDPGIYCAVLVLLLHYNIELTAAARTRSLATVWAHRRHEIGDFMLSKKMQFQLPEVLRALRILDAPRRVRALQKKIARLQKQGTAKPRTVNKVRTRLTEATNECFTGQTTSVSGALAKRVRRWLTTIPKYKLEFYAMHMPKELWRDLADIVHPSADNFQLSYFLSVCFGKDAPAGTIVRECANLNASNVEQLSKAFPIPYSYLRRRVPQLSPVIKSRVATYEDLDTLIWYYEELGGYEQFDKIIEQRLDKGEEPQFSYGKFMERLLFFKMEGVCFYEKLVPIAEKRLQQIALTLDPPVMVIGDCSMSMDVAIRTSTIIASLLCVLANAELRFFNTKVVDPCVTPKNVLQVLEVATKTKSDGLTAPAISILDLYKLKKVVKYFVVVTDEIENEPSQNTFFAQCFYKYYTEVYPAKIAFVSFLDDPNVKGRMVEALESFGIVPLQFRLDAKRPDLTKSDSLLGLLATESDAFSAAAEEMAEHLANKVPLDVVLDKIMKRAQGPTASSSTASSSTASSSGVSSSTATSVAPELEIPNSDDEA
eukprot:CAMPEP_0201545018 /NCGR_PEP_ID=MMETSP0173_2-20130828/1602_1 /ASSEMBLY_ACC=CAM_ASM_000268 /TAXON_ID=218659 /ORGANISM="Vexillifera sp., Strain DIVA3 564/2" /LENGTH=648 /DNA_ID=CAMNT_0047953323 /DNA_START=118 /DNA_END=2064 /DNA_ORIENTATION=+